MRTAQLPSRAHLQRCCPCAAHLRAGLPLPSNRASERLSCAPLAEPPGPPLDHPPADACACLAEALRQRLRVVDKRGADSPVLFACDGSSRDDVGAFAIAWDCGAWSSHSCHEDQSSFNMELLALLMLLHGLRQRAAIWTSHVSVGCTLLRLQIARLALPARALSELQPSRVCTTCIFLHWIPSHDKKPSWCPGFPLGSVDVAKCRDIKMRADAAAKRHLRSRWETSRRCAWARMHQRPVSLN